MNYGIEPECEQTVCGTAPECYVECEHTNDILESTRFIGNQKFLVSLLAGILRTQEQFISCICEICTNNENSYSCDICYLGDIVGFPPIQCGFIQSIDELFCNQKKSFILRCCDLDSVCVCSLNLNARSQTIDMCGTEEGLQLYTRIVNALLEFNGSANIGGIEEIASKIFPNSKVVRIIDDKISLYVQNLTDFEWLSLPIIKNALPVPIGMELDIITNCE